MIIGIESSCDDSSLALLQHHQPFLQEWTYTQPQTHEPFGGIVPDLAAHDHIDGFSNLLSRALPFIKNKPVEHIAVTCGPGLAGSLAIGISCAKALALYLGVRLRGINHLHGHAYSPFINCYQQSTTLSEFKIKLANYLPHLGLIVSGGNTLLFELTTQFSFHILAQTVDDAAGEAFDKAAKLLGLPYPGGPLIEKLAIQGTSTAFNFPRCAGISDKDPRFSFSGLKTSLRYQLQKMTIEAVQSSCPDICASYQAAIVDQLNFKVKAFLKHKPWKSFGLSGGVANNQALKTALKVLVESYNIPFLVPRAHHTTDNAAMIAFASWIDTYCIKDRLNCLQPQESNSLNIHPNLKLEGYPKGGSNPHSLAGSGF